ncbi:MAG: hypothetical protein JW741_08110, partial [Sedimentisphaerales bacterium]|nr:hypothetical protein [Sedimentisphaerales bacterium]
VVASNRAAGYDRAMGVYGGNVTTVLSHHRVAYDTIQTQQGPKKIERLILSWPLAAAVGASQHFIGERDFQEILFPTGLPWVFVFKGAAGKPEDGTVVVAGDIGALFQRGGTLYRNVRSLDEIRTKERIREELRSLPESASGQREALAQRLNEPMPSVGATLTLRAAEDRYGLFDFYGNPVPSEDGRIVIPLDHRGFFLRANPEQPGSFEALLAAIDRARINGLELLDIVAHDLLEPVARNPELKIELSNMLNRPLEGTLKLAVQGLAVAAPERLAFVPHERKVLRLKVRGTAAPDNGYPLSVRFDAGSDGVAVHNETLHVNWISRKTIAVDGKLDDWQDAVPQIIRTEEEGQRSFQEEMWLPFETFESDMRGGFSIGYLAYDEQYFYFAAKVADDSPHAGTIRYAQRNPDADFYPDVSYDQEKEMRWPEGVRRFSYRRWPDLPFCNPSRRFDNVLIAFNAIAMEDEDWLTHLPGRPPKFIWYKCTDYEFALNPVAQAYGGGTEIWTLMRPGLPRKHFFPRQPAHRLEGPVRDGLLKIVHEGNTRITEVAIPWSAIPHVKERLDRRQPVKFSYRVNHDNGGPTMELARERSVSKINNQAFHPDWQEHWANELEFAFER